MSIPPFLIEMFPPNKDALLHTMCAEVTDEMLLAISYGDDHRDVDKHLAELHRVRRERSALTLDKWHPREVIELGRYSDPKTWAHLKSIATKSAAIPDSVETIRFGETATLFCCAVLLSDSLDRPEYHIGADGTHAAAVRASRYLGVRHAVLLASFLAYQLQHRGMECDYAILGSWGLAYITVLLRGPSLQASEIRSLAEWLREALRADSFGLFDYQYIRAVMKLTAPPHGSYNDKAYAIIDEIERIAYTTEHD